MNEKTYRISIRLDVHLINKMNKLSSSSGQKVSLLIQRFFEYDSLILFTPIKGSSKVTRGINITLNAAVINKIDEIAIQYNTSRSEVIRRILYKYVNNTFDNDSDNSIKINNLSDEFEFITSSKISDTYTKLRLAENRMRAGDIDKAWGILNSIEFIENSNLKYKFDVIKTDLLFYKGEISEIAMIINKHINNNSPKAKLYRQLASIAYLNQDFTSVEEECIKALVYCENNPSLKSELLIVMAGAASELGDFNKNSLYLDLAKSSLKSAGNFYKGWFRNEEAMSLGYTNKLSEGILKINEAINFHLKSRSMMKLYYSYSIKSRLLACESRWIEAYDSCEKAIEIESNLNIHSPFTEFNIYKWVVFAHFNLKLSLNKLSNLRNSFARSNKTTDLFDYLISACGFIHGDEDLKRSSEYELKKLSCTNNKFNLFALGTLNNRKLIYRR